MNSFPLPSQKIASNWLLTAEGWVEHPLLEERREGWRLLRTTPHPDREPFTRFLAGVVVLGLRLDEHRLEALMQDHTTPLEVLLKPHLTKQQNLIHLSGLDYTTRCFTPQSHFTYL